MRRLQCSLLAAVAAIGFTSVAAAADMPVKAPMAVLAHSWTGFYVGGNVGYGWGDRTVTFTPNDFNAQVVTCGGVLGGTCAPPTSFNVNGALGGLQLGYNWQFKQNWLLGIETDFDWSRIQGTGTSNFILGTGPPAASNFQATQNIKWFGTIRGRLGFMPTDNMLVYGTAGFAYGRVDENIVLNSQAGANATTGTFGYTCVAGPNCFLGSSSRTATGWTAGAGFEYAPWNNNVSIKGEYLYVSLGGDAVNVVSQAGGNPTLSSFTAAFSRTNFSVVRVGLNYKFGGL
jgi:outer membrane immunogenic protein